MPELPPSCEEAFRLVLKHRTMLRAYVQAIVRDTALAEDTFSDVTLEIARSFGRFDAARPFEAWARGVARRVALANLRKHNRPLVVLDEAVLESIGAELDALGDEAAHDAAREALGVCVQQLPEASRTLVRLRYHEELSYEEISQAVGRSTGALYVAFNRLHRALLDCVQKRLSRA
jgi:RNA polymerase sigma-70 factor (ECF subfamily)